MTSSRDVTLTLSFIGKEVIDLAGCAVVGDNSEAFVIHVENEILALEKNVRTRRWMTERTYHDGQANETDIAAVVDVNGGKHGV